jgi:hypothetical protein
MEEVAGQTTEANITYFQVAALGSRDFEPQNNM